MGINNMIKMPLAELEHILTGARHSELTGNIEGISTDTRTITPGNAFFAICGDHFDAHDFVHEAAKKGAAAAIVSHKVDDAPIPQMIVQDTIAALGSLSSNWRQRFS